MKRFVVLVLGSVLLGGVAHAQEASDREDMRFVTELRNQGYKDLALEYLQKLSKNPSPELAKELPLEMAKTRLDTASDEPDSRKRLTMYEQARAEFDKFLKDNPNHPRASEARLDMAQVTVLQGRTQLSRALLQDTTEARVAEGLRARALFEEAGKQLQASLSELEGQLAKAPEPKTPAETAARKKLETDKQRAELSVAEPGEALTVSAALEPTSVAISAPPPPSNTRLVTLAGFSS